MLFGSLIRARFRVRYWLSRHNGNVTPSEPRNRETDRRAHEDSIRLPTAEIVARLRDILGPRLVAYIGHVSSTRPVAEWVAGARKPSGETVDRLRSTYFVAALLRECEEPATVQSWFKGMNPQLDDRAPAMLLRDMPLTEVGGEIVAAARSFAAN
jgi:hypothetical protein